MTKRSYTIPQCSLGRPTCCIRKRTGWRATMTGIPYDDLDSWRGPYPSPVFAAQMGKMAAGWKEGLAPLQAAVERTPAPRRADAEAELIFARAARLYFQSVANQTRFVLARDALAKREPALAPSERRQRLEEIRRIVRDELAIAREMFALANRNSCVGFETASQYFYLPLDLVEKVVSCRQILDDYEKQ